MCVQVLFNRWDYFFLMHADLEDVELFPLWGYFYEVYLTVNRVNDFIKKKITSPL